MRTVIGPSRYDGKPVYTLVYSAFPFTGTSLDNRNVGEFIARDRLRAAGPNRGD